MVVTENDALVTRLSEMFEKLGLENDGEGCAAIGRAIRSETRRLEEQHGKRICKLEEQINQTRVELAEAEGRIETIKTGMEGNAKLFVEMLSRLGDKVERIERNTSKEQSKKRAWYIALFAALPGVISVILRIIEMTGR